MAGRRHIDDDFLARNFQQVEDAKDGEELVDSWGNDIQQSGDDLAIKGEVDVDPFDVAAHRSRDLLLNSLCPASILGNGVEFGGEELWVAEHGNSEIADIGLENVVQRRRGISGADGDRVFAIR